VTQEAFGYSLSRQVHRGPKGFQRAGLLIWATLIYATEYSSY